MPKLTFDETLERINDKRCVGRDNVQVRALRRKVWLMMYSAPGCLPDHSETHTRKCDALDSARGLYADDAPRGFMADLRRNGIAAADEDGYYRVEVVRATLAQLF